MLYRPDCVIITGLEHGVDVVNGGDDVGGAILGDALADDLEVAPEITVRWRRKTSGRLLGGILGERTHAMDCTTPEDDQPAQNRSGLLLCDGELR